LLEECHLRGRSLTLVPTSANKDTLTVTIIMATETPAVQWIPDPNRSGDYIQSMEILSMSGVDLSRSAGMPFCDSHNTHRTIGDVLGTIFNQRVEGTQLVGDVVFRERYADLVADIAAGHLQQVSVGYNVEEYEYVGRDEKTGLPIYRASIWCPHEVSSVAIGADPNAVMRAQRSQEEKLFAAPMFKRSATSKRSKEKNMEEFEDKLVAAEEAFAAADAALAVLAEVSETDETLPEEARSRLAKLRARIEMEEEQKPEVEAEVKSEAETDEDKKDEEAARSIAKKRGKETEDFLNSLIGLKRGKELKKLLGDFIAARAIAQVSAPTAPVVPVAEQVSASKRAADIAKDLDPAILLARRKSGLAPKK